MNGDKLPSGWETVQIGDVVKPARSAVTVEPDTLYREIGIRSHGKGIFYKEPISGKDLGDKRVFWIEPGCFVVNIVFAWEGAVAQTTLSELGMIASHRFPMYKPDADRLDLDFITYFFKSKKGIHLLGLASPGGAGRNKTLGQQNFLQLQIPLPPLKEQKKMAAILQTCDEAIDLTEQLIAAKQRRKQALMQRLLTGQVRFPGFAEQWNNTSIENIASINMGQSPQSENYNSDGIGLPLIQGNADIVNRRTAPRNFTSEITKTCEPGDLILSVRAPVGEVAISEHKACIGRGVCSIRATVSNPQFLYQLLLFNEEKWNTYGQGSTFTAINSKDIKNFQVYVPSSLPEQERVATVLVACDDELTLHQQKLAALRCQKQGLMQQLLTGRVRVVG